MSIELKDDNIYINYGIELEMCVNFPILNEIRDLLYFEKKQDIDISIGCKDEDDENITSLIEDSDKKNILRIIEDQLRNKLTYMIQNNFKNLNIRYIDKFNKVLFININNNLYKNFFKIFNIPLDCSKGDDIVMDNNYELYKSWSLTTDSTIKCQPYGMLGNNGFLSCEITSPIFTTKYDCHYKIYETCFHSLYNNINSTLTNEGQGLHINLSFNTPYYRNKNKNEISETEIKRELDNQQKYMSRFLHLWYILEPLLLLCIKIDRLKTLWANPISYYDINEIKNIDIFISRNNKKKQFISNKIKESYVNKIFSETYSDDPKNPRFHTKYNSINLNNFNTFQTLPSNRVEIRLHPSINDSEQMMYWLKLCIIILKYCIDIDITNNVDYKNLINQDIRKSILEKIYFNVFENQNIEISNYKNGIVSITQFLSLTKHEKIYIGLLDSLLSEILKHKHTRKLGDDYMDIYDFFSNFYNILFEKSTLLFKKFKLIKKKSINNKRKKSPSKHKSRKLKISVKNPHKFNYIRYSRKKLINK